MTIENNYRNLRAYTRIVYRKPLWHFATLLIFQLIAFYPAYAFSATVVVGENVLISRAGFGKGPWKVQALATDGTASIQDANGANYNLHRTEYTPMVKSLGPINLTSQFIVHTSTGKGIWPVEGIGANGTLLSLNSEDVWVQFRPHEYTVLVEETGTVKKGGFVFPLIGGLQGGWPVKELGADGTVVTITAKDEWIRLQKTDYVPATNDYHGLSIGEKVIVIREGLLNLWPVNHIGIDGRIEISSQEGHYFTVFKNEYIKTVPTTGQINSTDKIFIKRSGFNGAWPIKAIGMDGRLLIEDGNGKQYLLGRSEYMSTVPSVQISPNERVAKTVLVGPPKEAPAKKERWLPIVDQDIEKGEPVLLKAEVKTSFLKREKLEIWVFPLAVRGKQVEVVLARDVKAATQLKNSVTSFLVPRNWLFSSTEKETDEQWHGAPKGELSDSYSFNRHLIPIGLKEQGAILARLKGKGLGQIADRTSCTRSLAGVVSTHPMLANANVSSQ